MRLSSFLLGAVLLAGCRGQESSDPPVHLNPNLDSQPRYDPQSEAKFFEDRRTMRQPVEGTVAKGNHSENDAYATGKEGEQFVAKMPLPITEPMLKRGQERYNIYCTPCHSSIGDGQGMVAQRGFQNVASLHTDHARGLADGELYDVIVHGVRNMPSYAAQIPTDDRWAIVAYVRALQISQSATAKDVPPGTPVEATK